MERLPAAGRDLIEGAAAAAIPAVFGVKMFPAEASLVGVCLTALLTVDSLDRLGAERAGSPVQALARRIVGLFLGAVLGYGLLALALPDADFQAAFSRQLSYLPRPGAPSRGFGDFGPILLANLYVLLFFTAVAFGFRKGGLMLAVGWNASVWGGVSGALARDAAGLPGLGAFLLAAGPHMLAEALAYVSGGLAGVLLGRGALRLLLRGEDRWDALLGGVGRLFGLALVLLLAGAAWESLLAGPILRALGG